MLIESDYTLRILLIIFSPLALFLIIISFILLTLFLWIKLSHRTHVLSLRSTSSMFSMDELEIPFSQLQFIHEILGIGAFGSVRKAIMKKNSLCSVVVAVKMTRG